MIAYFAVMLLPANTNPAPYHLRGTEKYLDRCVPAAAGIPDSTSASQKKIPIPQPIRSRQYPFPVTAHSDACRGPLTGDVVTAGILIVNMALWAASILFYRLVSKCNGMMRNATVPSGICSFFRLRFWLGDLYGIAVSADGNWRIICGTARSLVAGGVLGILTASTRLVGIIVAIHVVCGMVATTPNAGGFITEDANATFMPPLGTIAYIVYLWRAFWRPARFHDGIGSLGTGSAISGSNHWPHGAKSRPITAQRLDRLCIYPVFFSFVDLF